MRTMAALAVAFLVAAATPAAAGAAVDFSGTSIQTPVTPPREGDLVEFYLKLRNSGTAAAQQAQLSLEGPRMGYLVDVVGLEGATVDRDARKITASVSLPAGGELPVRLQMLAPRTAGGDMLSITLHLVHYPSRAEIWQHQSVAIDTRPSRSGIALGRFRIQPAGLAVIGWLAAGLLLWAFLIHRRQAAIAGDPRPARQRTGRRLPHPTTTAATLMIPLGFWALFGALAWRDWQTLTTWTETRATIVGRRTVANSQSSDMRPKNARPGDDGTTYTPEFALRYRVDGEEVLSTGYETGSALHLGGRVLGEEQMRDWKPGVEIICWYNPADPAEVIVRRGFGGAYFFALLPVPVFWFGLIQLRRYLA